jgi:hypothetical protein
MNFAAFAMLLFVVFEGDVGERDEPVERLCDLLLDFVE